MYLISKQRCHCIVPAVKWEPPPLQNMQIRPLFVRIILTMDDCFYPESYLIFLSTLAWLILLFIVIEHMSMSVRKKKGMWFLYRTREKCPLKFLPLLLNSFIDSFSGSIVALARCRLWAASTRLQRVWSEKSTPNTGNGQLSLNGGCHYKNLRNIVISLFFYSSYHSRVIYFQHWRKIL